MTQIRLGAIALDCADPRALAAFYARLFEVDIAYDSDDFAAVRTGGTWLTTQRVGDYRPPTWPTGEMPKQMHLDLAVTDLDSAESAAVDAGATKADVQPSPERWRVLIDPAGHPFCLSAQLPD